MTVHSKRWFVPAVLLLAGAAAPPEFPRVPPTSPADALKQFQVHDGLKIELVASEPLIESPVGICFDEDGRLFVVEMRGYPDRREERLGRIKLLESSKGDRHYDKASVYADNLPWPTGCLWYNRGLFVTASPDVIRFQSTHGAVPADERKVLFTGFGAGHEPLNVQGLVNGLTWGFDGRIHGTSSENGGQVTRAGTNEPPVNMRGKDFSFDPRTFDFITENGGGQHGLSYDTFGRKFVTYNNHSVETFFYDARYAARNPLFAMPPALADINADGPDVYRISPEEAWRVLRTKLRVAGRATGPIEEGGRASGYFTSCSGITMYTGDALPAEFRDNAFLGEPANNLVHRAVIVPEGVGVVAHRAPDEPKSEFVASPDIWFRPVQMANGPDGALYIVDMYREVIEHPWSLPDDIRNKLDLYSGVERGRIWRVVPENFTPRPMPHLSTATTSELVALLEHPNGWHRDAAARLLAERQDPAAVPLLSKLLTESKSGLGRLRALCALATQNAVTESHILTALHDPDAHVRERGVLLAENFLRSGNCPPAIWDALVALADDPAITVRYQLAFTLGEARQPDRIAALAKIARRDVGDSWMRSAILTSLADSEAAMFAALASAPSSAARPEGRDFLVELASLIGKRANPADVEQVVKLIESQSDSKDDAFSFALARSLREGLVKQRDAVPAAAMTPLLDRARSVASDASTDERVRAEAVRLLGTTTFAQASPALLPLLSTETPETLQLAAVAALDELPDRQVAEELVNRFGRFPPRVRAAALAALLKRPDRATALLNAISAGTLHAVDVPSAQATFLRKHPDARVRALAQKVLKPASKGRDEVIRAFQPALDLEGNAQRGHATYLQRCSPCHSLGGEGFSVGPDLTTIRNDGKAKALVNICDPNREVAANYVAYTVETRAGESLLGIVTDTASGVTVRQPFGKDTTVLRADIKRIESQHISLMPEGVEEGMKPQDMADLLEFIFTAPSMAHGRK
ncbi:MAG TPA: PVC-type heme-binding CxxCH protein [Tepidisphaeraceae bacterium]|jgi:putative membrane-bound dehydrogenase-like protein